MNLQKEKSPLSPSNSPAREAASATSDCLYQFAALTVGAFLLATLM
jgi:hypothetical protein